MRFNVKSGVWKNSEDETLKAAVMKYGKTAWARVASLLPRKTAKQCKARWEEWLDPRIKKNEWTRDEDEKLLHLAKILNSQWRTISSSMNRTAHQCLERYEQLINMARDEEGIAYNEENNPRRIRPGEIDPNPETRPARPDPVDMDDDEKQMLDEARARLSNVYGKKAKRKAREREMEQTRRLAAIQKRREMKSAGIDIRRKVLRRRKEIDYNNEVPFQRVAPSGYYDTTEDIGEEKLNFKDKKRTIEDIEGISKNEREKREKEKDIKKFQKMVKDNTPEAILQLNKIDEQKNIFNIKRKKLSLPAPQITDSDINEFIKDGYGDSSIPSGFNTSIMPTPVSNTPLPTSYRTPMARDIVLEEARSQLHEQMAPTPLSILRRAEKDEDYHYTEPERLEGTGSKSVLPTVDRGMTPNLYKVGTPLSTPGLALGLSTPLATPGRGASTGNETATLENDHKLLHEQLSELPDSEYEHLPSADIFTALTEKEEKQHEEEVDLSLLEQDIKKHEQELYEYEYNNRSEALKRGLPVSLPSHSFTKTNTNDEIEILLRQEMYSLLKYDMYKWVDPKKAKEPIQKEVLDEDTVLRSKLVIEEEKQSLNPDNIDEQAIETLLQLYKDNYLYNPSTKSYTSIDNLSETEKIECLKYLYNIYITFFNKITKKTQNTENKVNLYLGGYLKREQTLVDNIYRMFEEIDINTIERDSFSCLYQQEHLNMNLRIQQYEALVKEERERNRTLQSKYKLLINTQ